MAETFEMHKVPNNPRAIWTIYTKIMKKWGLFSVLQWKKVSLGVRFAERRVIVEADE